MESNRLILLFFAIYFIVGVIILRDYGISFDEPTNRVNGLVSAKYLIKTFKIPVTDDNLEKIPQLHEYIDKDYGVVFDLPLVVIEKIVKSLHIDINIYTLRHFFTFSLFFVAVVFFYLTAFLISKNQILSLIATLFLILSPRIFAESFYNSKDIGCLSFYIISIYFLIKFIKNFDFRYGFWLSILTAMTINSRIIGLIIPIAVILIGFINLYHKHLRKRVVVMVLIYLLLTVLFTILFWPYLWEAPLENFLLVWNNMKTFRWGGEVLYLNEFIKARELPWHYIPVYILITTPLLYSFFFIIGTVYCAVKLLSDFKRLFLYEYHTIIVCFILVWGPLLAVIVFQSVVYDGWRQLYFIYGPFLLISLFGIEYLYKKISEIDTIKIKVAGAALSALYVLFIGYWMVKYHPHQNVYFNTLAGKDIEDDFERDYWGLSYKQALEYIARTDSRKNISILCNLPPGVYSYDNSLPQEARQRMLVNYIKPLQRIKATEKELSCDYFITEFRYVPDPRPFYKEVYSIRVDNYKIIGIYRGNLKVQ